jgi:hypothetical protein
VFSNSIWANGNATITDNTTTAPNGTTTADSIFEQAVNDYQIRGQNISMVSGQTFTFSIYAKANTRNFFRILVGNGVLLSNQSAYFDLVNLTTTTSSSQITSSITSEGNGWCKIVISFTCNNTGTDAIYFGSSPNMTSGYLPFVGNASNGVFIWGAQLNIGSTAKPYFPTTDRLNVPRLTYQNGGGGCPSLLLEKQSTNYLIYNTEIDNAAWVKARSTVTANATTSPDGTQNADGVFVNSDTNTNHEVFQYGTGSTEGWSGFFKANGYNFIYMFGSGDPVVWFDLQNGTVGTAQSGASGKITNYGNGWYRCEYYKNSGTNSIWGFGIVPSNGVTTIASPDTSKGVYFWGAQGEAGLYSTSMIYTTSSSATRVADACSKTGISSLIGQTEGVIFLDFTPTIGQTGAGFSISDGTNVISLQTPAIYSDVIRGVVYSGGAFPVVIDYTFPSSGRYKVAFAYKANDFVLYVNGVLRASTTSGPVPTCSQVLLDHPLLTNEAVLFPTRLTNAELASLTTI